MCEKFKLYTQLLTDHLIKQNPFLALLDVNVDLSKAEIHLLCKILDTDGTDEIDFDEIENLIKETRFKPDKNKELKIN